jgi:hypothetical protein
MGIAAGSAGGEGLTGLACAARQPQARRKNTLNIRYFKICLPYSAHFTWRAVACSLGGYADKKLVFRMAGFTTASYGP